MRAAKLRAMPVQRGCRAAGRPRNSAQIRAVIAAVGIYGWNESRREDKSNEVVAAAVKQGVGVVQDV